MNTETQSKTVIEDAPVCIVIDVGCRTEKAKEKTAIGFDLSNFNQRILWSV